MYRILIVDDEPTHRRGMKSLIHTFKPDYLVFSARDGEQALDNLRQFEVDLIITDIRMPQMDGLEFIRQAKERGCRAVFAILSGYGEFEYARKAMALGVNRYLLKPANPDALLDLLNDFEMQMHDKEHFGNDPKDTQERDSIERRLEEFLLGYIGEAELGSIRTLIPDKLSGYAICVKPGPEGWRSSDVDDWKAGIYQYLRKWGYVLSFQCKRLDRVVVTLFATDMTEAEVHERVLTFRRQFEETNSELKPYTLGVSRKVERLIDRADEAFRYASSACQMAFYEPGQELYIYREEQALQANLRETPDLKAADISQIILRGESETAAQVLTNRFKEFLEANRPYPGRAREILFFNFSVVMSGLGDAVEEEATKQLLLQADKEIGGCASIWELYSTVSWLCSECCDMIARRRGSINNEALNLAMQLLQEEYAHDWTIKELAERFHFNPSYFSSMFKQYTGVGYLDYLTNVRLEKAAQLLRESDKSIKLLSAHVGYPNTAYFIKLFRGRYGLTPTEYRRVQRR